MGALRDYLSRPITMPEPAVLEAIERGPIDPGEAQSPDELDQLLEPSELPGECGWCTLPDGCGYVAMRTEMPGVTAVMVDWLLSAVPGQRARRPRRDQAAAHRRTTEDPRAEARERLCEVRIWSARCASTSCSFRSATAREWRWAVTCSRAGSVGFRGYSARPA